MDGWIIKVAPFQGCELSHINVQCNADCGRATLPQSVTVWLS